MLDLQQFSRLVADKNIVAAAGIKIPASPAYYLLMDPGNLLFLVGIDSIDDNPRICPRSAGQGYNFSPYDMAFYLSHRVNDRGDPPRIAYRQAGLLILQILIVVDLNMGYLVIHGIIEPLFRPAFHKTYDEDSGNDAERNGNYHHQAPLFVAPNILPGD